MGLSPDPDLPQPVSRRIVIPCWTHDETVALIDAYGEKWLDLRRGNLRAKHWEEVAQGVRDRCLRTSAATTGIKTAVQCRHKVEKLRQRYRSEKQRLQIKMNSGKPVVSSWVYFRKMDSLEMGNIGDSGIASIAPPSRLYDDGKEDYRVSASNSKATVSDGLKFKIPKALRSKVSGTRPEEKIGGPKFGNGCFDRLSGPSRIRSIEGIGEGEGKKKRKKSVIWEMVSAVQMLGDEFARIEEMKMKMTREMEKARREMELKHTKMILDSQRQIVDYIRCLQEKNGEEVEPK